MGVKSLESTPSVSSTQSATVSFFCNQPSTDSSLVAHSSVATQRCCRDVIVLPFVVVIYASFMRLAHSAMIKRQRST
jgi:hypothetical protein